MENSDSKSIYHIDNIDTIKLLVENGADLLKTNSKGLTPLESQVKDYYEELIGRRETNWGIVAGFPKQNYKRLEIIDYLLTTMYETGININLNKIILNFGRERTVSIQSMANRGELLDRTTDLIKLLPARQKAFKRREHLLNFARKANIPESLRSEAKPNRINSAAAVAPEAEAGAGAGAGAGLLNRTSNTAKTVNIVEPTARTWKNWGMSCVGGVCRPKTSRKQKKMKGGKKRATRKKLY